jgi:hypothetical protein
MRVGKGSKARRAESRYISRWGVGVGPADSRRCEVSEGLRFTNSWLRSPFKEFLGSSSVRLGLPGAAVVRWRLRESL